MWLKSIQLRNTKGFDDSGVVEFSEGINVLVGANNAGKSTILRSVTEILAMPHGKQKQDAKGELAVSVVNWALKDPVAAKAEFQESANEVLQFLGEIESKLS